MVCSLLMKIELNKNSNKIHAQIINDWKAQQDRD